MRTLIITLTGCLLFTLASQAVAQPPPFISKESAKRNHEFVLSALPKLEAIESITAEKTLGVPYGREVPPFVVPKEFHAEFMKYFENSAIDTDPIFGMPEMGSLLIATNEGKKLRLVFFCEAQGAPTMFSIQGVRCFKTDWVAKQGEAAGQLSNLIEKSSPKRTDAAPTIPKPAFKSEHSA